MAHDESETGAVLLAAGGGSRFRGSTHKLLAHIDGRPVVVRAVEALVRAGVGPSAVVSGPAPIGGLLPPGVVELANPRWEEGQATSLAVAVDWARAAGFGALVVGLGDQPGILASAWRAVAAVNVTPIAVATYSGTRGHPVRLARSVWDRLPVRGDRGAGGVIAESPELVTEVACDGDAWDVDTVEDLSRW